MTEQNNEFNEEIHAQNFNTGHQENVTFNTFQQNPDPTCPRPSAPPSKFAGRDAQIATLTERLKDGKLTAITAVQGLAGIGKTTVAQKIAHDLHEDKTFRAVLWTHITRNPNTVALLQDWANKCNIPYPTGSDNLNEITARLKSGIEHAIQSACEDCQDNRVLVVFDDVWDNGKETVELLQNAMPHNATVLITTRSERVAIHLDAGEDDLVKVDRLLGADGLAMLRQYYNGDETLLSELVSVLDGHALGMEIAIKRVLTKSATRRESALRDHIATYRSGLQAGDTFANLQLDGEDEDRKLTSVIAASYEELTDDDKARFRALGVLMPDAAFDLGLLSYIWQMEDLEEVDKVCDSFRLLALIEETDGDAIGNQTEGAIWYAQHTLLRAYARALLNDSGEFDETWDRYADRVIAIASNFFMMRDKPEEWDIFSPYLTHIHHIGDSMVEKSVPTSSNIALNERSLNFFTGITNYLFRRPEVGSRTILSWLTMGLNIAIYSDDKRRQALFTGQIGNHLDSVGQKIEAITYYEDALKILVEQDDLANQASLLNNIGLVRNGLGDRNTALSLFKQALVLARTAKNQNVEATTLNNIGFLWAGSGNKRKALGFFNKALSLTHKIHDKSAEAEVLNNIGRAWDDLGNKDKALNFYKNALRIRRAVGDLSGEAVTCFNIGVIYYGQGKLDEAIHYLEHCVELDKQVQHPDLEHDRSFLEQIKRERDGIELSSEELKAEGIRLFISIYTQFGEDALKIFLKQQNATNDVIETIIAQIKFQLE